MKTIKHSRVFETLSPPPDGKARLEQVLRSSGRRNPRGLVAAGASAVLLVITISLAWNRSTTINESDFKAYPALARLLGEDIEPDPTVTVQINTRSTHVSALRSANPDVRIYAISTSRKSDQENPDPSI